MDDASIKSTHTAVRKIIRLIVGTGALTGMSRLNPGPLTPNFLEQNTATVAIIDIALYYSGLGQQRGWFITPAAILGRLYSNSMMVISNNRVDIVGGRGHGGSPSADIVLSSTLGSFRMSAPDRTFTGREIWDINKSISLPERLENPQVVNRIKI